MEIGEQSETGQILVSGNFDLKLKLMIVMINAGKNTAHIRAANSLSSFRNSDLKATQYNSSHIKAALSRHGAGIFGAQKRAGFKTPCVPCGERELWCSSLETILPGNMVLS